MSFGCARRNSVRTSSFKSSSLIPYISCFSRFWSNDHEFELIVLVYRVVQQINGKTKIQATSFANLRLLQNNLVTICLIIDDNLATGATLKESRCPIIHIKGETTLFSCYDVGNSHVTRCIDRSQLWQLLVFFTEMSDPSALEKLNTADKDALVALKRKELQEALEGLWVMPVSCEFYLMQMY